MSRYFRADLCFSLNGSYSKPQSKNRKSRAIPNESDQSPGTASSPSKLRHPPRLFHRPTQCRAQMESHFAFPTRLLGPELLRAQLGLFLFLCLPKSLENHFAFSTRLLGPELLRAQLGLFLFLCLPKSSATIKLQSTSAF